MDYHINPRLSASFAESDFKLPEIIRILNTPPSQRSSSAINLLVQHTKSLSLFTQLSENRSERLSKECCQVLMHKFIPAGFIVFSSGDKGEFFYLVLDGQVQISIINENKQLEQICLLGPGGSFGELALIRDQPRLATIYCTKATHFATLCQKDYKRVLGHIDEKILDELISFFSSLPTFVGWRKKKLTKLIYYFKVVKFKRNQVIFVEGEQAESVFIVKKGEVEIRKSVKVERPLARKFGNDGRVVQGMRKGEFTMNAKISIEGTGEIIGDDDILKDFSRSFSCFCYSSTAELLEISKNDFKKWVRTEDSLAQLSERNQIKDEHVKSTLSMYKQIKKPVFTQDNTDYSRGKAYLCKIKEKNPWNTAQKEFGSQKVLKTKTEIIKKAIQGLPSYRSLPLSPKSPKAPCSFFNSSPKSIL